MRSEKLKKTVTAAVFSALVCITTLAVQIPSPMNGYVNLGDCFVLLSGWILGPVYGSLSAGLGSMLADLFTGYGHYAPGTFLIKGITALIAALVCRRVKKHPFGVRLLSGALGEIFMVIGYFFYASLFLGKGLAAASSIPGNLMQAAAGLVSAISVMAMLEKSRALEQIRGVRNS